MREIKFRAWDKKNKQMDVVNILDIRDNSIAFYETFEGKHIDSNFNLMQYTGLKDKNGVEIYDGNYFKNGGEIWVIVWNEDSACYLYESTRWRKNQHGFQFNCDVASEIEVIGNIYENLELLGATPTRRI